MHGFLRIFVGMKPAAAYHIPALLPQVIEALNIKETGVYADATFGGGGHSRAIADRLGPQGRLYALDRDPQALQNAWDDPRLITVNGNFRYIGQYLRFYGAKGKTDGILADLGVSFHHFDDPGRGFSFRFDGPLDMRMNQGAGVTAADLLGSISQEELTTMLRLYGELRQAPKIAAAICRERNNGPVATVGRLLETVRPYISPKAEKKELAQLFQALRITVNDEMGALRQFLQQALSSLAPGGRLVVITYHSLEDRLVKNFMKTGNIDGKEQKDFYGRNLSPLRLVGSKPIVADEEEVAANPRSRSAKLRVAVKEGIEA